MLNAIFPTAGFAGTTVNLYGINRISNLGDGLRDMGDIEKIKLGQDICSRFDIQQDTIKTGVNEYVRCIASSTQEAGKHNVTYTTLPVGTADHSEYLRRTSSIKDDYFEYTSLPVVSAVSPASGNIGGQYLTISGSGFSPNPKNNTVSVDGNNCKVTAASNSEIKCTLAAKDNAKSSLLSTNTSGTQLKGYFSGAGLAYARYAYSSSIGTLSQFTTAVRNSDTNALGSPQETGFRADLREGDAYDGSEAQVWRGYFTAPSTGTYTFRGQADDLFSFYIQANYGSADPATTPLLESSYYQIMFHSFSSSQPKYEGTVDLEAGKSYYI